MFGYVVALLLKNIITLWQNFKRRPLLILWPGKNFETFFQKIRIFSCL